jgi:hypothetical protein
MDFLGVVNQLVILGATNIWAFLNESGKPYFAIDDCAIAAFPQIICLQFNISDSIPFSGVLSSLLYFRTNFSDAAASTENLEKKMLFVLSIFY